MPTTTFTTENEERSGPNEDANMKELIAFDCKKATRKLFSRETS